MKPCILIFLNHYLPGYKSGGPVQTIANMVSAIGDRYQFRIITTDRDFGDRCAYPAIRHGEWMQVGQALVRYLAPAERSWKTYRKLLAETDFDLVYSQSFFDPKFTLLPLFALACSAKRRKPALVAPRGEFGYGALAHKSLKKKIYLLFFRLLFCKILDYNLHCSSEEEHRLVHRILKEKVKYFVALNFNAQNHIEQTAIHVSEESRIKLVFLGRLDIQKNLDYALRVLQLVKAPLRFDIYGPVRDPVYTEHCKDIAKDMPPHIQVAFKGPLPHDHVLETLPGYDLFFLPTKNENFGHVIHEALRAGLPILISDQTPWHEMEARNAGWECSLDDPAKFAEHIDAYAALSPEQRLEKHQAALRYGMDVSHDQTIYEDNIRMFDSLLKSN